MIMLLTCVYIVAFLAVTWALEAVCLYNSPPVSTGRWITSPLKLLVALNKIAIFRCQRTTLCTNTFFFNQNISYSYGTDCLLKRTPDKPLLIPDTHTPIYVQELISDHDQPEWSTLLGKFLDHSPIIVILLDRSVKEPREIHKKKWYEIYNFPLIVELQPFFVEWRDVLM